MSTLGTRIRESREGLNLAKDKFSKTNLAETVGISSSYLRKLEDGTADPTVSVLGKLALVLSENMDYFLYGPIINDSEQKVTDKIIQYFSGKEVVEHSNNYDGILELKRESKIRLLKFLMILERQKYLKQQRQFN